MRRRLLARLRALLVTAACGDVVERVKSMYVQLSFTSLAGHPLHLAASHFSVFFDEKRETQEKKKKPNIKRKREKRNKDKKKKGIFKRDGKTFLFRKKVDQELIQKDFQDFSHQKSFSLKDV